MKRILNCMILLSATCIALSAHAQIVVTDGDFTAWTLGNIGTSTMTTEAAGGNPAARLNATTTSGIRTWGTGFKNDFSTNAPLNGSPFTLRLDALAGAGDFASGQGQYVMLLVEQGGTLYGAYLGVTGYPGTSFSTATFSGTLTAAMFTKLSGPGAAAPDLSGAPSTRFGFGGGNQSSGTMTQYYDNFSLTIGATVAANATPIPTVSDGGLAMLAIALAALAHLALRRGSR